MENIGFGNATAYQGVQSLLNLSFGRSGNIGSLLSTALANQRDAVGSRLDQAEALNSLRGLNRSAMDLRQAAEPLTRYGADSVFNARGVESSDPEAVTGEARALTSMRTFEIAVVQTAQAQTVASDRLAADDETAVQSGLNQVRIEAGGQSFDISFEVEADATNLEAMQALAAAVDQSAAPVTARVAQDDQGEAVLELTGTAVGAAGAFAITDMVGDAVSAFNLDTVAAGDLDAGVGGLIQSAQNAAFSIDGGPVQESASNTVALYGGDVELQLRQATDAPVQLRVGPAVDRITDRIEDFLNAFNRQVGYLAENRNVITQGVMDQLTGAVAENKGSLAALGIEQNADGTLSVDREQLREAVAADPAQARDTFRGPGGLAAQAQNASRRIVETPMDPTTANALTSLARFDSYNDLGYLLQSPVAMSNFLFTQNQGFFINMLA